MTQPNSDDRFQATYAGELLGGYVNMLMMIAVEEGVSYEDFCRKLGAEAMLLAAQLHQNGDEAFMRMARSARALLHTGEVEQ